MRAYRASRNLRQRRKRVRGIGNLLSRIAGGIARRAYVVDLQYHLHQLRCQ